jgi:hypothetical protein
MLPVVTAPFLYSGRLLCHDHQWGHARRMWRAAGSAAPETHTVIGLPMRRAFQSLVLVALLLDPLALFLRAAGAGGHECADHVCLCSATRCPPRRTASGDHCQGTSKSAAAMQGACRHDKATVLSSATVAVLVVATPAPERTGREPVDPGPERQPPSGFVRIDPLPPRS